MGNGAEKTNNILKWAIGALLSILLAGGGFLSSSLRKPNEARVKELISREVNYPWPNDRPIVMERLRTNDVKITEIAVEQKVQGKQITDIDKNVGIILHELKKNP